MLQYGQVDFVHFLKCKVVMGDSLPLPVPAFHSSLLCLGFFFYLHFNMVYIVWYFIMVYYFCDAYFMFINQAFMQIYFANIFYITFFINLSIFIQK